MINDDCGGAPRRRSNLPEIARREREDRAAEALGADVLELEGDGVVVRHEAEELRARDAQAARAGPGDHLRGGAAVLQQADLAEEIPGGDRADLAALDHDPRPALEYDEETLAVEALLQDDLAVPVVRHARQLGETLDRLHVPVLAEAEPAEERHLLDQVG